MFKNELINFENSNETGNQSVLLGSLNFAFLPIIYGNLMNGKLQSRDTHQDKQSCVLVTRPVLLAARSKAWI